MISKKRDNSIGHSARQKNSGVAKGTDAKETLPQRNFVKVMVSKELILKLIERVKGL